MIIEIPEIDNVAEIVEVAYYIQIGEDLTCAVEVDADELNITIDESETFVQIEEAEVNVNPSEDAVQIIEIPESIVVNGQSPFLKINFSFDTPSPMILTLVQLGNCILETALVIETPFDDPNSKLSIGTVLDNELLLAEEDNDPTVICQFISDENHKFTMTESIRLFMDPGTSTQGSGHIILTKI